jgi:hypothetical protein
MEQEVGRSAKRTGSRPSGRASKAVSPVPASIPSADTADYTKPFFGILNPWGAFWTPLIFESEDLAREHISAFWDWDRAKREEALRRCKIVPVRAVVTLASGMETRQGGNAVPSRSDDSPPGRPETNGATHDQ